MKFSKGLAIVAAVTIASGAGAGPIRPGQWEVVSKVTHAEIPNAPPAMMEAMSKPHTVRSCVTQAQAEADPREMFKPNNSKCTFSKFALAGGMLSSVMTCSGPHGSMTVTTNGAFTPMSYTTHSMMVGTSPRGTMKIATDVTARRIGNCK